MGVIFLLFGGAAIAVVVYAARLLLRVVLRFFMDADSAATTATWLLRVLAIIGGIALIACIIGAFEGAGQAWGYVAIVVGIAVVWTFLEWLANR